jgi:lysophospholipase L1-like esterase
MGYRVAATPLLPLLYVQGRRLRRVMPRLPEPPGARVGGLPDDIPGADAAGGAVLPSQRPLRLLVLGDSAAAGVGATSQDAALLGQLVAALAPAGPVAWRLVARTGATAAGTRRHLGSRPPEACDVAVVSLGLNDVVAGRGTTAVLADLEAIVDTLQRDWGARHVVLSGMPPVGRFPALPQPLRWYMGRRARTLDAALAAWVTGRPGCEVLPLDLAFDAAEMAPDGFHPGPAMYAVWGRAAAARVRAAWHQGTGPGQRSQQP